MLCIDPSILFDNIILYDTGLRYIFMIILFYIIFYILKIIKIDMNTNLDLSALLPLFLGGITLALWLNFNINNLRSSDIDFMFFLGCGLAFVGVKKSNNISNSGVLLILFMSFALILIQTYDILISNSSHNYIGYSAAIFLSIIFYFCSMRDSIVKLQSKFKFLSWDKFIFILLLISSLMHLIEPIYVFQLMPSNFHDDYILIADWRP